MDHEPRGLGDYRQVLVLEADVERDLLGLERQRPGFRQLEHDLIAGLETVGRADGVAADPDALLFDERLENAT
jgi:hypothetical protein